MRQEVPIRPVAIVFEKVKLLQMDALAVPFGRRGTQQRRITEIVVRRIGGGVRRAELQHADHGQATLLIPFAVTVPDIFYISDE